MSEHDRGGDLQNAIQKEVFKKQYENKVADLEALVRIENFIEDAVGQGKDPETILTEIKEKVIPLVGKYFDVGDKKPVAFTSIGEFMLNNKVYQLLKDGEKNYTVLALKDK